MGHLRKAVAARVASCRREMHPSLPSSMQTVLEATVRVTEPSPVKTADTATCRSEKG